MKRSPFLRRTRLRARSAKTAERDRLRREFRERLLHERPKCEIGLALGEMVRTGHAGRFVERVWMDCTTWACDVHEIVKRSRGGSVLDPENCVTCCRNCHMWTEDEPALATALGFLKSRWTTG